MFTLGTSLAIAKISAGFALILFGVYKKWGLWLSILLGAILTGLLFGMTPLHVAISLLSTAHEPRFLSMGCVVTCIILLSSVQECTGQGQRLVAGLAYYLRSPRLRLIFFPALIGLLPMPGGAVFSCPMVRDSAKGTNISEEKKALINYWFRHIWEIAWPLYPGYILACTLADIPISLLWRYTWPVVILSLLVGLVCYLREPILTVDPQKIDYGEKPPLPTVLLEGLPILVALLGMPLYYEIFLLFGIELSTEVAFVLSLLSAVATATVQTRLPLKKLPSLLFSRAVLSMLLIIYAVYSFKDIIIAARVIDSIAGVAASPLTLLCLFALLPILSGLLTGLMAGFVGTSFPLLLGLLAQMGLGDERLTWIIFALLAGNVGQLTSPIHACFIISVEFFHIPLPHFWRRVVTPAFIQFVLAGLYVATLHFVLQVRI